MDSEGLFSITGGTVKQIQVIYDDDILELVILALNHIIICRFTPNISK